MTEGFEHLFQRRSIPKENLLSYPSVNRKSGRRFATSGRRAIGQYLAWTSCCQLVEIVACVNFLMAVLGQSIRGVEIKV